MRRGFTPEEDNWLQENVDRPYAHMATKLQRDVVTIKRRLVFLGLRDFETPKLQPSSASNVLMWSRPCLRCKDTSTRPKNTYFCASCSRANEEYSSAIT